jgi:hypothetical protein
MKQIEIYETSPTRLGTLSFQDTSIMSAYAEAVKKFIQDALYTLRYDQSWLETITTNLTQFDTNDKGELTGSSPFMNTLLQTVFPEGKRNLITGKELLRVYESTTDTDNFPFAGRYVDFGLALRTPSDSKYPKNDAIAQQLAKDVEDRNIALGEGIVPDFYMMDLEPSKDSPYGAVFRLNDFVSQEGPNPIGMFQWKYELSKRVARAYLDEHEWNSRLGHLSYSDAEGRVVRFDAEGAESRILRKEESRKESGHLGSAMQKIDTYGERFNK